MLRVIRLESGLGTKKEKIKVGKKIIIMGFCMESLITYPHMLKLEELDLLAKA